ncbi:MAG: serine/threonine protein phosphatase [Leptolyngbya sp. LCM1.Bin17]|nr:MAG: serine/threonine protein phosphatase [Leptolyngbya sp. LCM1.Bin17]
MNRVERLPSRMKPYLWAVGEGLDTLPLDELVSQRYRVVAPRVWLDTRPEQRPDTPDSLPPVATPYLTLHHHRLHVPGLYGVLDQAITTPILLLENAPLHPQGGELYPTLETGLFNASPLRQINWIWQMWELWPILEAHGVATSLLTPNNVRVEGWRLRLLELVADPDPPELTALTQRWRSLLSPIHISVSESLGQLLDAIDQGRVEVDTIGLQLNQILLTQGAAVSSRLALAGAVTQGPTQPRNEDACWPYGPTLELGTDDERLQVGIICDGVGGHDDGEVASQLAVQSLQIQLQSLLAETQKEFQLLPPQVVTQQLEAVIRIVNELLNFQNDNQGRVGHQRMGTTLVMAVIIPQRVQTDEGWGRVNEVYLAHVGDSRAYWITPDYCHQLTVDDDIASREVLAGRQTWPLAKQRTDAGALTQALGTRGGDHLHPHIQRLILDETGLLLLCSDGLSDNYRIEDAWANYIGLIIKDIVTLESAVASWIELANQKNGHDNTAVVLMQHKLVTPIGDRADAIPLDDSPRQERGSPGGAKLYGESLGQEDTAAAANTAKRPKGVPRWLLAVSGGALLIALVGWWLMTRSPTPPTPTPPAETEIEPES